MNTVSPDATPTRIVMFGLDCGFTNTVAARLTALGHAPVALIVPGHLHVAHPQRTYLPARALPMAYANPPSAASDRPTYRIGRLTGTSTLNLIESLEPDVIVVACFPRLIPQSIRAVPRLLACNIHPSLLPSHRGPDPLFWIMRAGGIGCGVTVHELSEKLDSGDILEQRAVPYPAGAREDLLEQRLAAAGAELTVETINALRHNNRIGTAQDEATASYETWPEAEDFAISVDRPVLHAWNFIRGVASRGVPVRVETGQTAVHVIDAVEYGTDSYPPRTEADRHHTIRFSDGWLVALTQPATAN